MYIRICVSSDRHLRTTPVQNKVTVWDFWRESLVENTCVTPMFSKTRVGDKVSNKGAMLPSSGYQIKTLINFFPLLCFLLIEFRNSPSPLRFGKFVLHTRNDLILYLLNAILKLITALTQHTTFKKTKEQTSRWMWVGFGDRYLKTNAEHPAPWASGQL